MLYTIPIMVIALLLASVFFHRKRLPKLLDGRWLIIRLDCAHRRYPSPRPSHTILPYSRFASPDVNATLRSWLRSRLREHPMATRRAVQVGSEGSRN